MSHMVTNVTLWSGNIIVCCRSRDGAFPGPWFGLLQLNLSNWNKASVLLHGIPGCICFVFSGISGEDVPLCHSSLGSILHFVHTPCLGFHPQQAFIGVDIGGETQWAEWWRSLAFRRGILDFIQSTQAPTESCARISFTLHYYQRHTSAEAVTEASERRKEERQVWRGGKRSVFILILHGKEAEIIRYRLSQEWKTLAWHFPE